MHWLRAFATCRTTEWIQWVSEYFLLSKAEAARGRENIKFEADLLLQAA